jgi:colicin import membrane protein
MSLSNFKNALSRVAYCAIFVTLVGCASGNSSILNAAENDALSVDNVRTRANLIPNLAAAQLMEQNALARQKSADDSIVGIESACMPKFLVNKCISDARTARNTEWDNAQIDLTAARLYLRTNESKQQQQLRQQKYTDYQAEQVANAPMRAANKAAFESKKAAFVQRQAEYAAEQAAAAPERAANVSAFQTKQDELNALKKKRVEDAAKRAAEAAAKSQ